MLKRFFDLFFSCTVLCITLPVCLVAALGILLFDFGPVFFFADRSGKDNVIFKMLKFRTMKCKEGPGNAITSKNDPRVFFWGSLLRKLKIDELPNLINILRGEMSVVGPRPEDPKIVTKYYVEEQMESLKIPPGLTSPGTLFYLAHGEQFPNEGNVEQLYAERLLPIKLALDLYYVNNQSFLYDLKLICYTLFTISAVALGKKHFSFPEEYSKAHQLYLTPTKKNDGNV